MFIYVPEKTS